MDDAALERAGGGLSAVGHAEFSEDVVDVTLHSRFTDVQRARDFFVRLTFHDLLKDLELSIRELRSAHAFGQSFCHNWRKAARAGMDLPDSVLQLFEKHIFQQIALCARLQCTINIFIAVVSCENDDARLWEFVTDRSDCLDAALQRHTKIHQSNVRLMLTIKLDCL